MNNLFKIIGLGIFAAYSAVASAVPTLFFDGTIEYSAGTVSVDAQLTNTSGIAPSPNTIGSSLNFSALLASVDTTSFPGITIGHFDSNPGFDDLEVFDGDSNLLLSANFTDLAIFGANGNNAGNVYGFLTATGGSLASSFGVGNLVALQLNLSTVYAEDMFDSSSTWNGNIDGDIEGQEPVTVPEPGIFSVLALGLMLIGFSRVSSRINTNKHNNQAREKLFITTK